MPKPGPCLAEADEFMARTTTEPPSLLAARISATSSRMPFGGALDRKVSSPFAQPCHANQLVMHTVYPWCFFQESSGGPRHLTLAMCKLHYNMACSQKGRLRSPASIIRATCRLHCGVAVTYKGTRIGMYEKLSACEQDDNLRQTSGHSSQRRWDHRSLQSRR